MKKLSWILLVVLCVAVAVPSQAQFRLALGGVTGMNFSIHSGSDLQATGTGVGFAFGAQADMSFSKNIGLVTTLYFYDGRGGSYNFTTQGVTANYDASVGYFMIEPLFKYTLPKAPVYLIIGPAIGFAVQGSYAVTATGYTGTKGSITDMNARFEIKAGAGYIFPLSKDMRINGQFTFGYGPSTVQSNVNWRIMTFGLHGVFQYDIVN